MHAAFVVWKRWYSYDGLRGENLDFEAAKSVSILMNTNLGKSDLFPPETATSLTCMLDTCDHFNFDLSIPSSERWHPILRDDRDVSCTTLPGQSSSRHNLFNEVHKQKRWRPACHIYLLINCKSFGATSVVNYQVELAARLVSESAAGAANAMWQFNAF